MVQQAPWTLCYHPSPKGLVWKNSDGWSLSSNLGHSWRTQRLQKSKLLKVLLVNLPTFCSRRKTLPLLSSKGYKSVLTLRKKSKLKSQFTIFQGCSYNNILKKKKKSPDNAHDATCTNMTGPWGFVTQNHQSIHSLIT